MDFESVKAIAAQYGATDFLGSGGESWVFALNDSEVIRIQNPEFLPLDQQKGVVTERINLYAALNKTKLSYAIPEVYAVLSNDPVIITKEKRIHGIQLRKAILNFPDKRDLLYANYFLAIFELTKLPIEKEHQLAGVVLGKENTPPYKQYATWLEYMQATFELLLQEKSTILEKYNIKLGADDIKVLQDILREDCSVVKLAYVHGDYNPENILVDPESCEITGLLDFSDLTVIGDPRLDLAGAFLLPEITHEADPSSWPTKDFSRYMQQELKSFFSDSLDRLLNVYRLYYVLLFANSSHPWVKANLENFIDILHAKSLWVPAELLFESSPQNKHKLLF